MSYLECPCDEFQALRFGVRCIFGRTPTEATGISRYNCSGRAALCAYAQAKSGVSFVLPNSNQRFSRQHQFTRGLEP